MSACDLQSMKCDHFLSNQLIISRVFCEKVTIGKA